MTKWLAWPAAILAVLATIEAYYWYEWRSFQAFVIAIDHSEQFMQDFVGHYYPMGQELLQTAMPKGKYFYSSFFALLLVPVSRLPLPTALTVWASVQVACTAALVVVSARFLKLSRARSLQLVALFALSYPILHNFKWGQVSVLLTLCVVAALVAARRGRHVLGGVVLAFGASIKFYPALFLAYFIVKRDVRACAGFLAGLLTFYILVPASFLGLDRWFGFERAVIDLLSRAGLAATDTNSQYVASVVLRWLGPIVAPDSREVVQQSLVYLGYAIGLAAAGAAAWSVRQSRPNRDWVPVVVLFLSLPFVVKTSWPHYFSYLPLCQAALLTYFWEPAQDSGRWRRGCLALCVASAGLSSMPVFNLFSGWEAYNADGMLFLSNLLLVVPTIVVLMSGARRREPSINE